MKTFKFIPLGLLLASLVYGDCSSQCNSGARARFTMDPSQFIVVQTPAFPDVVPASIDPNAGSTQGAFQLTPNGLKVCLAGNYLVNYSLTLRNDNPNYQPVIPTFLIQNGEFNQDVVLNLIGSTASLPPNEIRTLSATGILENVACGTVFSLVMTNGGSPEPEPVTLLDWNINAIRLPCRSTH